MMSSVVKGFVPPAWAARLAAPASRAALGCVRRCGRRAWGPANGPPAVQFPTPIVKLNLPGVPEGFELFIKRDGAGARCVHRVARTCAGVGAPGTVRPQT